MGSNLQSETVMCCYSHQGYIHFCGESCFRLHRLDSFYLDSALLFLPDHQVSTLFPEHKFHSLNQNFKPLTLSSTRFVILSLPKKKQPRFCMSAPKFTETSLVPIVM